MNFPFLLIFLLSICAIAYSSPIEENFHNSDYYYKSYKNKNLKDIFKDYIDSYKDIFQFEKNLSPEARKLIEKNKKFLEIGRIKAFSKVHGGKRGKSLYIYKDFKNEIQNINLKNSGELYILTTIIDSKILKNRKLNIKKYMENVSIRQTGVSSKKKETI